MFGRGYGGSYPPDEPHRDDYNDRSAMIQGRYEDPPPHFQPHPSQRDSSQFHRHNAYYPPEEGHNFHNPPGPPPPVWPHDARYAAPPSAYPPQVPSFYPPQQQSFYPPHSEFYPSHYGVPHTSSFGEHAPHTSSFGERPPHALSFGEHAPRHAAQQHALTDPHAFSFKEQRHSSDFVHVSSFTQQGHLPSIDAHVYGSSYSQHSFSFDQQTTSLEAGKPLTSERESVGTTEMSGYVNPPRAEVELPKGQLVRVFCKANRSFNLAVKDSRVMMVLADTEDESQQWIRDDKYSIRVRDSHGHPAFMLINKETKKALRHGDGKLQEVKLMNYTPEIQDDDLFWTESQDFGEGFKTLRPASDTLLNLSVACIGITSSGNRVENGSPLVLDTWHKKENQMWKIFPL